MGWRIVDWYLYLIPEVFEKGSNIVLPPDGFIWCCATAAY